MEHQSSHRLHRKRKSRRPSLYAHWFRFLREEAEADWTRRAGPRDLDENEVLSWADGFYARHGDWPTFASGPIPEAPGETWLAVAAALLLGMRGFLPRRTLGGLIDEHRRTKGAVVPRLSFDDVLAWAKAWHSRTGEWPKASSGEIPGAGGVSWGLVDEALRAGRWGMPGGCSLARLLLLERRADHRSPLSEEQILMWADAHYSRTGRWPRSKPVAILEAPDETWSAINVALYAGQRGLPGGSSLPRLLMARRQVRSPHYVPPLEIPQILKWAEAFHARTKRWPNPRSGPIREAPGETWLAVSNALVSGRRGMPGGTSIARLLVEQGKMRHAWYAPPLTVEQILRWADAFHAQTGDWPKANSGAVPGAAGEKWSSIEQALRKGFRGLSGGSSLFQLLSLNRGERDPKRFAGAAAAALSKKSRRIAARSGIMQRVDPRIEAFLARERDAAHSKRGKPPRARPPRVDDAL